MTSHAFEDELTTDKWSMNAPLILRRAFSWACIESCSFFYIDKKKGDACGVIVIVIGNGQGDTSRG